MEATTAGQVDERICGQVTAVSGSEATARLNREGAALLTVGRLLEIRSPQSAVVAVVTSVTGRDGTDSDRVDAKVDLLGEIVRGDDRDHFQRGISDYPVVGTAISMMGSRDLTLIYDVSGSRTINIGHLSQDPSIGAFVDVDEMINKHFALLGTTGVGKSSGVAVLLRQVLEARPKQRVFMIDPHNEYAGCFGDKVRVLTPHNLRLPHWLFNFEETIDVIYRARPGVEEEVEILNQVIGEAKNQFAEDREGQRPRLRKSEADGPSYTVDTPVPYRMTDVISLIDARMGKLENRAAVPSYLRLMTRIDMVMSDPRYRFMFHNANVGGDTMVDVVSDLFNLQEGTGPITVLQLAGFPAEVVDSLVSVLCRMAFELGLWSGGALPVLMVCEEAHRYAPADKSIGFGPTKKAISRIAKEGRKYNVSLGLVTQRPAELDPTIVSQCSTLFAMRMANDRDQDIVRSAVSDAAASLLAFVPALGTREVFAFGEGVALPTRLRFSKLAPEWLPLSNTGSVDRSDRSVDRDMVQSVIDRWRRSSMSRARLSGSARPDSDGTGLDGPLAKNDAPSLDAPAEFARPAASLLREHEAESRSSAPSETDLLIGRLRRQSQL